MTIAEVLLGVLFSFLIVAGLGGVFGAILAAAHSIFHVKKDGRIDLIEQALPGLNCGICGYAGCSSYAESIGLRNGEIILCLPGGDETAKHLAEIVGVKYETHSKKNVTQVHCRGGKNTSTYDFTYSGIEDCNAAFALYGGDKTCKHGCLALDSCIRVCPVDAIKKDSLGLVWVDKNECIGCGKCVEICPTGVMRFIPYTADVIVACNSTDTIPEKKRYCSVSCIGCIICEKKSPDGGYKIQNQLSTIDYKAEGEREKGRLECPTSCIVRNDMLQ